MTSLPDVNVLLSLVWANHPHHTAAQAWFTQSATAGWATCLLTQIGFLRLSLNSSIVGVALDCPSVVSMLASLMAHPNYQFLDVAPTLTGEPFDDFIPRITGHQQVTDAALLHLARFHGMKLVTLDRGAVELCPWSRNVEVIIP